MRREKSTVRNAVGIALALFWMNAATADEPAACYIARDPTGDFSSTRMLPLEADIHTAAQITRLVNADNRITGRCMQRFMQREGGWPNGASITLGARIAPTGKVAQVSVLEARNISDSMLMACLGRAACDWALEPRADGQERLIRLPPYVLAPLVRWPSRR